MTIFNKSTDYIAILAPASKCNNVFLNKADISEEMLKKAQDLLSQHNLNYKIAKNIFSANELPYFAASKEIRFNTFKEALLDPFVKIIWAFRGGYGCTEFMLDCLSIKPNGNKILIGFSDITALHVLFNQYYNMPSIHASVLTSLLTLKKPGIIKIIELLDEGVSKLKLKSINGENNRELSGVLMGGNLTVFCNLIGTSLHPHTKGKILIFEDINEKGYHVHRHLIHLKNAGLFDVVKAIIFGDFTNSDEYVSSSIEHFCKHHIPQIPTYKTNQIGHGKYNYPIILGNIATIKELSLKSCSPFKLI